MTTAQFTSHTVTTQFDLHTRLFRNVLEGITDQAATTRHNPNANHLTFLAGHLVFSRLLLKDFAGLPSDDRFAQFEKNMDPAAAYLPLATILAKWDEIAEPMSAGLKAIPAEVLASNAPFPLPTGPTVQHFIDFMMHHEAYHLGQLGILRKFAGQEAMSYT